VRQPPIPRHLLARVDESPDPLFYRQPRFVQHIDDATIAALTDVYRERLPAGGAVLDLMSSWVSHLPPESSYGRVAALGMNREELAANPRASDFQVRDLNATPTLPYEDTSFDAVVIAVSVQYLIQPIEVFREIRRVLRPGCEALIAVSHRVFPTKAVGAFRTASPAERPHLARAYFEAAGGYEGLEVLDRSPAPPADPLWVVTARRAAGVEAPR
jgi:SAM-dependent methyltransferase